MRIDDLQKVVDEISYKDWQFRLLEKGDGFLLQVEFMARCIKSGELALQRGRKWYISSHACRSEIVRTAYKAIEAAEMHELHENFKYKGKLIFDPHIDPLALACGIEEGVLKENTRFTVGEQ